jgi:hypothetical protein
MKIRVVSSREEIGSLRPNEKVVHLAFRASNVDFLNLLRECPRLQVVQTPHSYMVTASNALRVFLEMQGVKFLEGDVWGHRKDIDEYYIVPDEAVAEIKSLTKQGIAAEEIAKEVQKKAKVGAGLVEYIGKTGVPA